MIAAERLSAIAGQFDAGSCAAGLSSSHAEIGPSVGHDSGGLNTSAILLMAFTSVVTAPSTQPATYDMSLPASTIPSGARSSTPSMNWLNRRR